DEAGHHDHPRRVDQLRVRDPEIRADVDDLAVLDEDLAERDVPDLGVHRDDVTIADQQPLRAHASSPCLSGQETLRRGRRMCSDHKRSSAYASMASADCCVIVKSALTLFAVAAQNVAWTRPPGTRSPTAGTEVARSRVAPSSPPGSCPSGSRPRCSRWSPRSSPRTRSDTRPGRMSCR